MISEVGEIVKNFNEIVRKLFVRLEKKTRSSVELADIDRLKKRLSLLKQTMGLDAPVAGAAPFLIEFAQQILDDDVARRETFFTTFDARNAYIQRKGAIKPSDEFIFGLIESIKNHYKKASRAERDEVYAEVNTMLTCALEYQIIQDDQNK